MKCPKCGKELRQSKKNPDRLLCDMCRKGFNRADLEDDYEDYDYTAVSPKKQKKKMGALKIAGIVIGALLVLAIIGSALGDGESVDNATYNSTGRNDSNATSDIKSNDVQTEAEKEDDPDVPTEYKSALSKAESYSDMMHMSKQGIYDQLTSEYGEKFSAEAAQYAIDNLGADYKANALEKAKEYQDSMSMSPEAIRDQLTSEYGEKFTQEEADYAVENLP